MLSLPQKCSGLVEIGGSVYKPMSSEEVLSIQLEAVLGVYEMNRIELLRDLYLWAYERSTKEYLAVKQELVKPDQQRLQYRAKIKEIVKQVILTPESQPLDIIESLISNEEDTDKQNIIALALEELRRIHDGVLARYDLRPSQLEKWRYD